MNQTLILEKNKNEIVKMFQSGIKVTKIAESFGISRNYIYNWFKRENIKYDCRNKFSLDYIKINLQNGESIKSFCKKNQITKKFFKRICNEYNYNYLIDYKHIKKTTSKGELSGFAKLVAAYKRNAKKRNIDYQLNDSEFMVLVKQNCFYCNCKPSTISKTASKQSAFKYNGIDRIDNSIGYIKSNVVTCCKLCNQAKSTLTIQEFKNLIENVYNNFIKDKK